MAFELAPLPYPFDALEPAIDAKTMEIHHGKHHAAYVNNLNKALEGHPDLLALPVEKLIASLGKVPDAARPAVRNNGGGHFNHTMFWSLMKKGGGGEPQGDLKSAIAAAFGSFADFKTKFAAAGVGRFGSGWAWLLVRDGKLVIESTPNQDSPVMDGVDVGRHARVTKAIVDKGVRIPASFVVGEDVDEDKRRFTVTPNGVVVIPREARLD